MKEKIPPMRSAPSVLSRVGRVDFSIFYLKGTVGTPAVQVSPEGLKAQ